MIYWNKSLISPGFLCLKPIRFKVLQVFFYLSLLSWIVAFLHRTPKEEEEAALRIIKYVMVYPGQCVSLETALEDSLFSIKQGNKTSSILHYKCNHRCHPLWLFLGAGMLRTSYMQSFWKTSQDWRLKDQVSVRDKRWFTLDWGNTFIEVSLCFWRKAIFIASILHQNIYLRKG